MNRVVDLFGVDVAANRGADWKRILSEQRCPYAGKKCFKVRKSQPDIAIGTCTVQYGRGSVPIMICPLRLLERRQIFVDCLHLLQGHSPGNELHIVSEVGIPGGSVDYFLVSVLEGRVRDFVGIELQTLDTTGTVWPERQRLLQEMGVNVEDADVLSDKSFGMNWKMTAKTILVQLHHKVSTFEYLNKNLVLVIQDKLFDYMRKNFNFKHLNIARNADPMHFHPYRLTSRADGHRMALDKRFSTDMDGIAICLGLQAEANLEIEQILAAIETKISAATLFTFS